MQPPVAIIETAVYAEDLFAAETFYREVLGFDVIAREEGRHVFFRVGTRNVLLVFNPQATLQGDLLPHHGATGPTHVAFGIPFDELPAWRQRLADQGIAIETEIDWPRGGKSIYFRDPAGNSLELITPSVWGLADGW